MTSVDAPKAGTWLVWVTRGQVPFWKRSVFSTSKVQVVHRQCCLVLRSKNIQHMPLLFSLSSFAKSEEGRDRVTRRTVSSTKETQKGRRAGRGEQAQQHVTRETVKHNLRFHYDMAEWREVCGSVCEIVYNVCEQE